MKRTELQHLINLFLTDSISDNEFVLLQNQLGMLTDDELEEILECMSEQPNYRLELSTSCEELFSKIWADSRVQEARYGVKKIDPSFSLIRLSLAIASVAAILILLFTSVFNPNFKSQSELGAEIVVNNERVLPGGKHAKIILPNGKTLDLEILNVDSVVKLNGYSIKKKCDGSIVHLIDADFDYKKNIYNTIVTPKGGEFSLVLSDGSRVHLNADSKLQYPVEFVGDSRQVMLEGEGYFEIAKKTKVGKKQPFIVRTGNQSVEVLGTVFNINSYSRIIQTTLIEGAVKIRYGSHGSRIIKPNQQSNFIVDSGYIEVHEVDPYYVINWKNGMFAFEDASIYEVMNAIGRWYNVDIQFEENLHQIHFSGTMSRTEDISKVLRTIELTGEVKFKRTGRRILVMK